MYLELKNKLLSLYCFEDNEYLDLYCDLMKIEEKEHNNSQIHHIIPKLYFKTLGISIDNSNNNIIELSYKNHILAHYYLFYCTKGVLKDASAMAFLLMTKSNINDFDIQSLYKEEIVKYSSKITSIPVYCVETETKYESAREAWKDTGIDWSSISKCCKGRKKTAGGYHWQFYEDFINNIEKEYIGNYQPKNKQIGPVLWEKIPVICLETKKQYSCVAEASKDTGISSSCISDVIHHKYYTAGGYHWQSVEDYNNGIKIDISKSKTKKVLCIETNVIYDSVVEASKSVNKNKNSIAKVCRGENKTCGGYHWKYL